MSVDQKRSWVETALTSPCVPSNMGLALQEAAGDLAQPEEDNQVDVEVGDGEVRDGIGGQLAAWEDPEPINWRPRIFIPVAHYMSYCSDLDS